MDEHQMSNKNASEDRYSRGDPAHEDDGCFSDVPVSGSLSRSQLALNKFMKKNLLYEENDHENDDAYFSKESTPNDSGIKYDSDSASDLSVHEKEIRKSVNVKETHIGVEPDRPPSPDEHRSEHLSITAETQKGNNTFRTVTHTNPPDVTEQTDDYKYKQLCDHSNGNSFRKSIALVEYSNNGRDVSNVHARVGSASLDEVSNARGPAGAGGGGGTGAGGSGHAVFRDKSSDVIDVESGRPGRARVRDVSDWANRTDVYPDVYAPLPYKSPRRYVESDVNIHYRCPVRRDPLPLVPEKELARQQAEHMKRLYREQRRSKYLQENEIRPSDIDAFDASMKELQDMQNRRHRDNFTPSQKNILPLNRYDEAERVIAKALYTFNGQTSRELSFRKGDIIHVRRQIDSNWYEGEIHGRIGLFPYNYVEIQKGDAVQPPRKAAIAEGRARAKFEFTAQTNLELPLKKGEVVALTRRIDQNWWEGRNGAETGIFPDSYVTVLQEPSQNKPEAQPQYTPAKPAATPAAHGLLNGSARGTMAAHSYTPQHNSQALSNAPPATQPLPGYASRQPPPSRTPAERGYGPPTGRGVDLNNTEPLYVDTNAEAVPYRAMYKYRPQNPDEVELNEGDTVYVLEQCDDGWYVGSSQRTGRFGTFPGNYVERI